MQHLTEHEMTRGFAVLLFGIAALGLVLIVYACSSDCRGSEICWEYR
jgi:hypothetical protein